MKNKLETVIELLAGECLDCEDEMCVHVCPKLRVVIGDVLNVIDKTDRGGHDSDGRCWCNDCTPDEVIYLWRPCGINKSLQEIFEDAEWEWLCDGCGSVASGICCPDSPSRVNKDTPTPLKGAKEVLKDPAKQALAELLIGLFYNEAKNLIESNGVLMGERGTHWRKINHLTT